MISKDIVDLSILMKSIRTDWLQTAKEREQLFELILNVKGVMHWEGLDAKVTEQSYHELNEQYEREISEHLSLISDYIPSVLVMTYHSTLETNR